MQRPRLIGGVAQLALLAALSAAQPAAAQDRWRFYFAFGEGCA